MNWAEWAATDAAIRAEFHYPVEADLACARRLHAHVDPRNRLRDLGVEVRNRRNVAVLGCGPSLEATAPAALAGKVLVACDGAATWLRENRMAAALVVTDLDGRPEDLEWAARQGSAMVVHAHGDNAPDVDALAPRLGPRIYGTYQGPPQEGLEPMRNVGGFTDGDRAVALCEELGALQVTLVGFDFDAPPSRYSHRWDPATKARKLDWARRIVESIARRGRMRVEHYVPLRAR